MTPRSLPPGPTCVQRVNSFHELATTRFAGDVNSRCWEHTGWHDVDSATGKTTVWPEKLGSEMLEKFFRPWIELKNSGVGVHCGECGCYNKTPHAVFLAWFGDVLDILTKEGIGYALWEFSGDFGVLNSGREDVAYEGWHGQKLDRRLPELLQKY